MLNVCGLSMCKHKLNNLCDVIARTTAATASDPESSYQERLEHRKGGSKQARTQTPGPAGLLLSTYPQNLFALPFLLHPPAKLNNVLAVAQSLITADRWAMGQNLREQHAVRVTCDGHCEVNHKAHVCLAPLRGHTGIGCTFAK